MATCNLVFSQVDTKGKGRFDFAKTALGIGLNYSYGGSVAYVDQNNQILNFSLSSQFYPVIHFGGLHFWNSTELYFSFPLGQLLTKETTTDLLIENNLSSVFGIKYYP